VILLFNPRATKPRNRRLPLSVLALAAVLEGREEYGIVDGNVDDDPISTILRLIDQHHVELLGVTVMPGPQMAAAMEASREVRSRRPHVIIVWGGYFPSTFPDAALNAKYVDYVVRGQGEDTLIELIEALRTNSGLENITTPASGVRSAAAFAGFTPLTARGSEWRILCEQHPFLAIWSRNTAPTRCSSTT